MRVIAPASPARTSEGRAGTASTARAAEAARTRSSFIAFLLQQWLESLTPLSGAEMRADLRHEAVLQAALPERVEILEDRVLQLLRLLGRQRGSGEVDLPRLLRLPREHQRVRIVEPHPVEARRQLYGLPPGPQGALEAAGVERRPAQRAEGAADALEPAVVAAGGDADRQQVLLGRLQGLRLAAHGEHQLARPPVGRLDLRLPARLLQRGSEPFADRQRAAEG